MEDLDIFEVMHTRRSIRSFTDEPVSEAQIRRLLEVAMVSPTAGNQQCWRFVVITEKTLLAKIPDVQPYAFMVANAAAAIIVCGDVRAQKYPPHLAYWIQDGAAAIQSMLLAARAMGLATCWCGLHPQPEWEEGIRVLFGMPEHVRPLGICAVGHSKKPFTRADRFDPAKVHYNGWQS